MNGSAQRRRLARIPVACAVGVRDRGAAWVTQTVDVGARGCRISLERPLTRGGLVELLFDCGEGHPLQAVGQVAWTRAADHAAGIVFVNLPRDASGAQARNWIDALVAAQLRQVLARWPASNGALSRLADVVVQLGIPPTEPLPAAEVTLIRLARDGGVKLGAVSRSADALGILVGLLEREILSVVRETPDPEGWRNAFARLASWGRAAAAQAPGSPPRRV